MRRSLSLLVLAAATGCFDDPYTSRGGLIRSDAGPELDRVSGEMLYLDTSFNQLGEMGDGPLIVLGPMQKESSEVEAAYEEAPGSPFACKAYEMTPEQFTDKGVDIGAIDFTVQGGPPTPTCQFAGADGWVCSGTEGTGGDIQVVDAAAGVFSLTNSGVSFGADEVGRHIDITGAANPVNNGVFPIVAAVGENTIHFYNPASVEELATGASYITRAGFGPARQTDPIPDDAQLTVNLTPAAEGQFEPFDVTLGFGDSFTLDTASREIISNIPLDGSEFTIGCDGEGGECGAAMATALNIETTDADIDPSLPFSSLSPPVGKSVRIFCIFLIGRVTVNAEASAYLASSGAKRIRTIFVRALTTDEIQAGAETTIVAGHGVGGFTVVE